MTREEAIEYLMNISYQLGTMSIEHLSEKDGEKMREAIKALEQEPFINKPCVAHQICHEDKVKVLDKIRVEIVHLHDWVFSREEILRIIDKYKSERSDKE